MGLMQSAWAVGYALAAAVNALVLPRFGWRAVFFVGLRAGTRHAVDPPPRRRVAALARRPRRAAARERSRRRAARTGARARPGVLMAMNAATMFAWWGLFTWIPSYLARPVDQGGAGLSIVRSSTWIIVMQVGMWCGYVSFGFIADAIGRKKSYVIYLVVAAVLVPIYAMTRDVRWLLVLGPFLAFFGTGYFSGFGAVSAELFPTHLRATAQGLTYNAGRALSALAPSWSARSPRAAVSAWAFLVTSVAFARRRDAVDLDS